MLGDFAKIFCKIKLLSLKSFKIKKKLQTLTNETAV